MTCPWTPAPRGGFLQAICPQLEPLTGLDEGFRQWALRFLEDCYVSNKQEATFRESPAAGAPSDARTVYCGLRMLAQLGDSELFRRVKADRAKIGRKINSFYNPQLEVYQGNDNHQPDSMGKWHLHDGYLYLPRALKILDLPSKPIAKGLDKLPRFPWALKKGGSIPAWVKRCTAGNPRSGVKEITQYLALYRMLGGKMWDDHIEKIFGQLIALRDPETGFIGRHDDPGWAMRGHRNNILVITLYEMGIQEPVDEQLKVINSTLALQRPDGLYHDGSMCANMDAIQLLAECTVQTGYLRHDIRKSIERALAAIVEHLAVPAGGVHYEHPSASSGQPETLVTGLGFMMESIRFGKCIGASFTFKRH